MNDGDLSPALKAHVIHAFSEGLRQLISSAHGVMPENAVVLNVISCLCLARKELGYTEEQTRDAVIAALNTNMVWASKFGGET